MRTVLGIDAAWTSRNPSGVALVAECERGWELVAVSSSYEKFSSLRKLQTAPPETTARLANVEILLSVSKSLTGNVVDLIAIDMPISLWPIEGRRAADNSVSKEYGGRNCGTHTPSISRPGRISDELRASFESNGYPLMTKSIVSPGLIEVYPHPALVELAQASDRLKYKYDRRGRYWGQLTPSARLLELKAVWSQIVRLLGEHIRGVAERLPELKPHMTGAEFKAFEDSLDAIVCAWVGICALEGLARPYGDEQAAIWIPCRSSLRFLN